jgi:hypothetical protein
MGSWDYWRPAAEGVLELGTVSGEAVGLPTHFHREDQLTYVLSGRRRFVVGGEVIVLEAGDGTAADALRNVDHSDRADVRFARPNIQIYDAHVVDLYQGVCARYLVGVKGQKQRRSVVI